MSNQKKILVTSALPYVNNTPHLGNIIGCVLSADVYTRFCRLREYETLYICGTDEYGSATEFAAEKKKLTPKELCDLNHNLHKQIYEDFSIKFDNFGRTSTKEHSELVQQLFKKLLHNNLIEKKELELLKCLKCDRALADRFVIGTCHHCDAENCRGDQCDACGKLIDVLELKNPKCNFCKSAPQKYTTNHLFLNLNESVEKLSDLIKKNSKTWSPVAREIATDWLKKKLENRCITRDLKWGVQIPLDNKIVLKEQFEKKVFYVWFDAPIGYISITKSLLGEKYLDWWKDEKVRLVQFMGKDNVPFHSIIFPSTLIGANDYFNLVNTISSTHYLLYENSKFSKSNNTGVFGQDVKNSGIDVDVWRYYLLSIRPENSDARFSWDELMIRNNTELLGNLGNLVSRIYCFTHDKTKREFIYEEKKGRKFLKEKDFGKLFRNCYSEYIELMETIELKKGLKKAMAFSSHINAFVNHFEPWKMVKVDVSKTKEFLGLVWYLILVLAKIIEPFMPDLAKRIKRLVSIEENRNLKNDRLMWDLWEDCGVVIEKGEGTEKSNKGLLIRRLTKDEIGKLKKRFG